MDGHFEIDERRWREKVRHREMEIKRKDADIAHLREELAKHLGKPIEQDFSEYETKIAELNARNTDLYSDYSAAMDEIKALKDKIKGLNMQLGRLKGK